jgi:hypothetical protein
MKHVSRLLSLLVLAAAFVVLTGSICQKSTPERTWERGAFHPTSENIKNYSLPSGVTVGTISSYEDDWLFSLTPLFMLVSNSTSSDVQVTFPAGLVFGANPPLDTDYEYMILLQEYVFTVNGGANLDTVIALSTYGCNEDNLDPPDDDAFYSYVGIEWDKDTQVLLDLLADKALVSGDDDVDLVQEALSEITDFDGLTDSTKALLQELP